MRASWAAETAWAKPGPVSAVTSTFTSTERPGRRAPASGEAGSTAIFTGRRWAILVKLPTAFSTGISANSEPVAGAKLSTWPLISCLPNASAWMVTGWPTRRRATWVSLKLAIT